MRKILKRSRGILCGIIVALTAAIMAVTLTACTANPKQFDKAGMSITLTTAFTEKDLVSQTAYYESRDSIVTALKEEFSLLSGSSSWTVSHYTDVVMKNNKLTDAEKHEREGKEYIYFTYEKTVSGKQFFYLATTHKSSDAFWLIQFACDQSKKDAMTDTFLGWADTVTFSSSSETI
ncbi:MAG: hypothetical protein K2N14_05190 [Clostridia bacterium]|nr:hypothetical protein [Clostridia bacterium]